MFALSALSVLGLLASSIFAAPAPEIQLAAHAPLAKRTVPAAPYFVVYSDDYVTNVLPDVSEVAGYNVFALAFLWSTGGQDQAQNWEELTAAQRNTSLAAYHAAGISVVVSAFGSIPLPTTDGEDPTSTAQFMAQWVIEYGLDGIDVDYEDLQCFDTATCEPEAWLETFTTTLRATLTQGDYILTHAPLAPWFSSTYGWANGGYLAVDQSVGDLIDWYNVQFYNQGTTEYTTCAGLLTASSTTWPETALFQISANGVDVNKLVIGKPATAADASTGYTDPITLAGCLVEAVAQGWGAGVMSWQYPHANASYITEVRASAWAVAASVTVAVGAPTHAPDAVPATFSVSAPTGSITANPTAVAAGSA